MAENLGETVLGGVVVLVAAGFLAYAGNSTGFFAGNASNTYDLTASFRSADGVSVGTDVRLAGVKIGSVKSLDLNVDSYRADVTFAVANGVELPEDTSVAISSEGLLGGTYVEMIPGGSPVMLEPGAEIEDTQGAVSLIGLLAKFVSGRE